MTMTDRMPRQHLTDTYTIRRASNPRRRCDPPHTENAERASRRNSMAIQDMLNPSDAENDSAGRRSPSYSSSSSRGTRILTPAPSPPTHNSVMISGAQPTNPRQRQSSDSSQDSGFNVPARSRAFRPAYEREQILFLWFHDIDIGMQWDDIVDAFHAKWPGTGRVKSGMQCKLYRTLEQEGIPAKRSQASGPDKARRYGMWANRGFSFEWMDPYADKLPGYVAGGPYHDPRQCH